MGTLKMIQIFRDTQEAFSTDPELRDRTAAMQQNSRLYPEQYRSSLRRQKGQVCAQVVADTTLQCAEKKVRTGKRVAVLNFANPHEPGGGVLRGAVAQEECLCRSSNLYQSLNRPCFMEQYYAWHRRRHDFLFSDRVIYSPGVTVIKSDDAAAQRLREPYFVDVITCAAPYRKFKIPVLSEEKLLLVYTSRIRNILETAMENDVDILILGAFGCGAFGNDPKLMAKAFYNLLIRERYAAYFSEVVFAIKKTRERCPNFRAFQSAFCRLDGQPEEE